MKKLFFLSCLKATIIFVFSGTNCSSQKLSMEKALYYRLKISKAPPENYIDIYGHNCDNSNYIKNRSDEFTRMQYRNSIKDKISKGIQSVKFGEKFVSNGWANLGEYDFELGYFPITEWRFNEFGAEFRQIKNSTSSIVVSVSCSSFINELEFNKILQMTQNTAKDFVQFRKSSNGRINRSVYLRATFSILDKVGYYHYNDYLNTEELSYVAYIYSIDIFDDEWRTKKLTTLYPKRDYYDKVHGILLKDGEQVIYYNNNWKMINEKENASYYRVVNYSEGKISGPVIDYYISGHKLMEGNYGQYYAEKGLETGKFLYYYESGQKSSEVNYLFGKKNGPSLSWHENGVLKEWVDYFSDSKEGCHYKWKLDGECDIDNYFNFFNHYVAGTESGFQLARKECPCKKAEELISK